MSCLSRHQIGDQHQKPAFGRAPRQMLAKLAFCLGKPGHHAQVSACLVIPALQHVLPWCLECNLLSTQKEETVTQVAGAKKQAATQTDQ